jgi:hypothetical protein
MKELAPVGGKTNAYGIITAPNHKGIPYDIKRGKPWAGDLGCLQGPAFIKKIDIGAVAEWLVTMEPYKSRCLFLAGGDIVGNAQDTLDAYAEFEQYFTDWPLAYVAQNGAEKLLIPETCAAVFIGGVPMPGRQLRNGRLMDWKDSPEAVDFIKHAQAMGKHIHIGRVNWHRRFKIFQVLKGCEKFTFDGTRTRYDGTKKTIVAWQQYQQQPPLITI